MGYDGKYGKVTTEHGDIPDDEPVMVFRARDRNVPAMLSAYLELCEQAGSPQRHLDLVVKSKRTIVAWQRDHRENVRIPDSERSRAWLDELPWNGVRAATGRAARCVGGGTRARWQLTEG